MPPCPDRPVPGLLESPAKAKELPLKGPRRVSLAALLQHGDEPLHGRKHQARLDERRRHAVVRDRAGRVAFLREDGEPKLRRRRVAPHSTGAQQASPSRGTSMLEIAFKSLGPRLIDVASKEPFCVDFSGEGQL